MTEEYPDDVEAWIELAGILEQSDVQVHQPYSGVLDLAVVGGTQQSFIQGDSTPRPNSLPFFIIIIIIIIIIVIIIIDTYSAISIKMVDCASHPFTSIKCVCWPFSTPLQTKMTDFPTVLYTQLVKSQPFHIPEAWKRYPFWAEPPRIGHFYIPRLKSFFCGTCG